MSLLSDAIRRLANLDPELIKEGVDSQKLNDSLEQIFPLKLPEELYEFYQLTDGLNHSNPLTLVFGFGSFYSLSQAIKSYLELVECPDYNSGWFPLFQVEDWIFAIIGHLEQRATAPVVRVDADDVMYGHYSARSVDDWQPQMMYFSLTDLINEYIEQLEYPYG